MPDRKLSSSKISDFLGFASQILWFLASVVGLGFPAKYRKRLRLFESLIPEGVAWSTAPTYSDRGSDKGDSQKTLREKQQEEWDRMNITMSVITATSAAALAIQAASPITTVYWLVTAFYSTAFGLSLEGLILNTYMTISAGGSSDEAIGRLAKGELIPTRFKIANPVAFIMALPAILATYSSISLLVGLVVMVFAGPGEGVEAKYWDYVIVTMVPVGIAFLFLCVTIIVCELGECVEERERKKYLRGIGREEYPKRQDTIVSTGVIILPNPPNGVLPNPPNGVVVVLNQPSGTLVMPNPPNGIVVVPNPPNSTLDGSNPTHPTGGQNV